MGRSKLTDEQRHDIYQLYWVAGATVYAIAKKYKVSRATVQFIIHPHLAEQNKERMKLRQRIKRNERKEMKDATSKN